MPWFSARAKAKMGRPHRYIRNGDRDAETVSDHFMKIDRVQLRRLASRSLTRQRNLKVSKPFHRSIILGLFAVGMVWSIAGTDFLNSQEPPKKKQPPSKLELDQKKFMRKKLEASSQILEGLATENASLITQGARVLAEMSAAEQWKVLDDATYGQYSGEFQRAATGLRDAAETNNFDSAALKWIDTTMKCIECHKFVRSSRK